MGALGSWTGIRENGLLELFLTEYLPAIQLASVEAETWRIGSCLQRACKVHAACVRRSHGISSLTTTLRWHRSAGGQPGQFFFRTTKVAWVMPKGSRIWVCVLSLVVHAGDCGDDVAQHGISHARIDPPLAWIEG